MTGFSLKQFSGTAPKVYPRLLPQDMSTVAQNVRLDSGRIEPWKGNAAYTITPVRQRQSLYLGTAARSG